MSKTIYTDADREIVVEAYELMVSARGKHMPHITLSETTAITKPDARYIKALHDQGKSPDDYYCIASYAGGLMVCMPNITRDVVEAVLAEAQAEQNAKRNDPALIERNRIHDLYNQASRRYHALDDNNIADYHRLTAQADAALAQWKLDYPEAAREEHKRHLLDQAAELKELAKGALFYDSDGWLSEEMQQQRHDEMMAQADALVARANEEVK